MDRILSHKPTLGYLGPSLRQVWDGEVRELKGRVGVIGGGDVAMDCARVAKRLGGEVTVIYRRTREEMPAHHEEVMSLLEEQIPIRELAAPWLWRRPPRRRCLRAAGSVAAPGPALHCAGGAGRRQPQPRGRGLSPGPGR